jgi:hypothetical protein
MTAATTTRIAILLALLAGAMFFAIQTASPASAQEPEIIVDCYDIELESFVPCEDLDFDGDQVDTPSQCPEGTTPVQNAAGGWTCVVDEEECRTPLTHVPAFDPCDPTPNITCERIDWAKSQGYDVSEFMDWYNKNCVRDNFNCRSLNYALSQGALLSAEAWEYYYTHCVEDECPEFTGSTVYDVNPDCDRPELNCREIAAKINNGQRVTRLELEWYYRHCVEDECPEYTPSTLSIVRDDCDEPRLTCEDLEQMIKDGIRLSPEQRDFYRRYCDDTPKWDCEDLRNIINDGGRLTREQREFFDRYCDDTPRWDCEDLVNIINDGGRLTREQREFFDRYCDYPEYTCEELLELGILSEEEYNKLCDREDIPLCVEDCDEDDTPECEDCNKVELECEGDCEPPLPPKAGTGAIFDTFNSTNGLGFASVILIALGGAVAGVVLRRKS